MNIPEIAKKYAINSDERLVAVRLCELALRASVRGNPQFSLFLTPAERALCLRISELKPLADISFHGGYAEAERTLVVFCPKDCAYVPAPPISVLALDCAGHPSHRDILGSVMALGFQRNRLGDIIAEASPPLLFCDTGMADYVISHLERIGHLKASAHFTTPDSIPPPLFESKSFTVQSPRLDSIAAEGFAISRPDAVELIQRGQLFLNWIPCVSPAKHLQTGDQLSLRGHGRLFVAEIGGLSRKGRLFVTIHIYK